MKDDNFVYIIGAGGHAKVVIAALQACGISCHGIYDDNKLLFGKKLWNIPILGAIEELPDQSCIKAVIAIGSNCVRKKISEKFINVSWQTIIHPHSWVHSSVKISAGTVIFAGAIIQPDTIIGLHSIINTSVSVDHDCNIGDYCHIAPGCHIAGGVTIGNESFIGIGTAITPEVNINSNIIVGAGSAVINNLDINGTYVGTPAKRIK